MRLRVSCRYSYPDGFEVDAGFTASGTVVALWGPSGSGKTTVLSLIAGLHRPAEGRISVDDTVYVDTAAGTWMAAHQRGVGFVPQDNLLFPHLDVAANLAFGARRRPGSLSVDSVVEVLGLRLLLRRSPGTLSGGEARRVAIGRALLSGPRLLLLDEPWTGLDDGLKIRIVEYLQRVLNQWRIPTLLVTHDRDHLDRFADQVVEMRDGRVVG